MPAVGRDLWVALLIALALGAGVPAAAQARLPTGFVGVTAEDVFAGTSSYRSSALALQRNSGVRLIRQTFDWRRIEGAPRRYDLSAYDTYVADLASRGIRVLPILYNTPRFHSGTRTTRPAQVPRSNSSMARFARVLVRRYGPDGSLWKERPALPKLPITAWQVWNEPNLAVYWRGRPNARAYARMLRTVGGAIRRVHRRADVVSAGLAPSRLRGTVPLTRFISQLLRAKGSSAMTSLAINSYARNERELVRLLRSVRRLMNRRGGRRDTIWITELGWATSGPRSRFRVGSAGQATRIRRSFAALGRSRRSLRLRGVVYYSWRDLPPYGPKFADLWGLHAGLLTRDGRAKPGLAAFRGAVSRLR